MSADDDVKKGTQVNTSIYSVDSDDSKVTNPFLDPDVAEYWRQVYEESEYECRKAFDPDLTWTVEEETKIRKKLDVRVALVSCFMFICLQLDRGNISQALSDNFLKDLKLTTNDYNLGNTVFLVSFLAAELPSQLISKWLGPDIFVPIQMCAWSIVAASQAALSGKKSFLACRALLGLLEGGFIADLVLWLSYFYKSKELPIRLSWFWTTLSLVQILSSLLAFGILRLRGHHGMEGWRWLFLLEGLFTLAIGISSFYLMVPSAVQTKNWMHPKGWFTDREEKIVVNRVLRDDPTKGDMHNRQPLSPKQIWKSLIDYDLWPIYAIGLMAYIPTATLNQYLTLTLRQLGFSTFNTNLLTIPHNVLHIVLLLIITWLSEKVNEISLLILIQPIYTLPLMGIIRWWSGSMVNAWGTYVVLVLILGNPYIHAICVSWTSRNSGSIRSRSVGSALYNMFVQTGNIAASNIYRADDKPLYHRGNTQLFFICLALIPLFILTKVYYVLRNKWKLKKWNAMTPEEKLYYINNTSDEGNKRLDFLLHH